MLTYPDRQTFEQIRARWETAQPGEDRAAKMVGRREKPAPQQVVGSETLENGISKFGRKLSHGLAFISNPFSQRKTAPGRHQINVPLLAVEPSATDVTATLGVCDTHLSPARVSTSSERSHGSPTDVPTPADNGYSAANTDSDSTPKPLPRSRTLSLIPLPVKVVSKSFAQDFEGAVKPHSPATMSQPEPALKHSKIPTLSPPLPECRGPSPRQYLQHHASHHASQQIKHIAAAHAFAAAKNGSPRTHPLRSRTTPNLVKGYSSPVPSRFIAPRQPGARRPAASPTVQKPVLQENIPLNRRIAQRRSQIQEKSLRRESLTMPDTLSNRRSFGPGAPLAQSRQPSFVTPPAARKCLSSHLAQQTPVTVKRVESNEQAKPHIPDPTQVVNNYTIPQPRLMGLSDPPTPTRQIDGFAKPVLPRSSTDNDMPRKILGTPNGLGGVWRSSRALATTTHEVRRLPRSHTFHNFGSQWEAIPPVAPIPEQYRTPSLPNLTQALYMDPDTPVKPRHNRLASDATLCHPIEETNENQASRSAVCTPNQTVRDRPDRSVVLENSKSSDNLTAIPSVPSTSYSFTTSKVATTGNQNSSVPVKRPWSISEKQGADNTDVTSIFQVKDYMPPLYWAGRFQSRLDQWRTDAMQAELNLQPVHQTWGPLGECKLNQEKLAACYIFAQLRDLCTSKQAADSLWEFEYKYRKDHKLLDNPLYLPPMPSRKQDDGSTQKGAFGRAMRKLTPRKSSLVNLMKGRAWNRSDEMDHNTVSEQNQDTSSECS